jgi:hypothetical protein
LLPFLDSLSRYHLRLPPDCLDHFIWRKIMTKDINLDRAYYVPTEAFKNIPEMTSVCDENMKLIAVTGPSHDQESEEYAELFRAAPRMYKALKEIADRGCKCLGRSKALRLHWRLSP